VQLFPERDHRSRRFLALALVLSLVLHFAGGSLWALLARSARALAHQPEEVLARTQPITIERPSGHRRRRRSRPRPDAPPAPGAEPSRT